ncbi:UDP-N-acetylenolpyruvoylglucosamine reductase [Aestuariivirga litoralis]|uniref:UDP-N-acetylenolpyruvoylglucosamine reductase n=1 Tax=Aestuariivirga litoralis TaxID=2650924 RepID=A0A2W2AKF2_9HYPH|nr:UDP-N-acetylmuramate dehydrogenase [Aestuariivirga litoralis]PZF75995.1 UDP-N-acetylenolpyruvoylglucosamine reductase [Aestuariivirga litoralis]
MTKLDGDALLKRLPQVRGRLEANAPLADLTWFRAGGPAEVLFTPADEADLAAFLKGTPKDVPVYVIGVGSNLLVRDGGVPGVVIRLGKGFAEITEEPGHRVRAGTASLDVRVARFALEKSIDSLTFLRGIPGTIGGALRMNAGAYGGETKDILIEARAVDRSGAIHVLSNADMKYTYRHCGAAEDLVFTQALFQGRAGDPAEISAAMDKITESREATQPIKSRTGGSTFKNPPGNKSWQLIDKAGMRGFAVGPAKVSELHCNFLINEGGATAAQIEELGETVRARVKATSGIELDWEIKRIGLKTEGAA